jgi:hypothetical protein
MVFSLFAGMLVSAKAADPVVLTVYAQNGDSGLPIKVKDYTQAKLEALAETGYYAYNSGSGGIVEAFKYIELDDFLANVGIADKWEDTSKLKIEQTIGSYYGSTFTKAEIEAGDYYHPTAGDPEKVPAVLALETAAPGNDPRFLFGRPENLPNPPTDSIYNGGKRLAKNVDTITLIYPESPVLYIYAQDGSTGTPELAASYSQAELAALAQPHATGLAYQFYKGTAWQGVVATDIVPLDTLLSDAGIADTWVAGAKLKAVGLDGYLANVTYEAITDGKYYIDGGGATEVPAGISITWWSGELNDTIENLASGAYYSGALRFVFGITQAQYDAQSAAGSRLANMVETITIIAPDKEDEPETPPTREMKFTDVTADDWFFPYVKFAFEDGIVTGTSTTTFSPSELTTRAQFIQMLYALAKKPAALKAHPFTDSTADWYQDAIKWAFENKVTAGITDTTFAPDSPITREQIAVILRSYIGAPQGSAASLAKYEDADQVSSWAVGSFAWAIENGLISGRSATISAPGEYATRAEIATILYRFAAL